MNETTAEMVAIGLRALIGEKQADDAGKRDVQGMLDELFAKAGYELEYGDGFAYASEV